MIATKIQIRFADVDAGGHVHNAAYLHYFESARIGFFFSGLGQDWDWKKFGFIVKKNIVEYNQPVYLQDQLSVEVNCIHIGEKSFTLSYHVVDNKKGLMAYGESIIVCLNYLENKTITIPDAVKKVLTEHYLNK